IVYLSGSHAALFCTEVEDSTNNGVHYVIMWHPWECQHLFFQCREMAHMGHLSLAVNVMGLRRTHFFLFCLSDGPEFGRYASEDLLPQVPTLVSLNIKNLCPILLNEVIHMLTQLVTGVLDLLCMSDIEATIVTPRHHTDARVVAFPFSSDRWVQ